MPVIDRNTPVAQISVPIPQPVQNKPKQLAPTAPPIQPVQQPRPQHRPLSFGGENDQFGRRVQGVSAVILPWSPQPKRMSRPKRYSLPTEQHFHDLLDTNPNDHHTRLVFADWLQDRDDPRAEGYRALGKLRVYPSHMDNSKKHFYGHEDVSLGKNLDYALLPEDWFNSLPSKHSYNGKYWKYHNSRREAEDQAALTFSQLPEERKAEILQPKKLSRKRVVVKRVKKYTKASY